MKNIKYQISNIKYQMGFLALVLFGIGIYLILVFISSPTSTHAPAQIIKMTPWGFQPSVIQINAGDSITFENTDSNPHWPASNIHPTHAIYPEFDPKKGIPKGQSWSFVFDKPGVWRFHDHLNSGVTGQITVASGLTQKKPAGILPQLVTNIMSVPQNIVATAEGLLIKTVPGYGRIKLAGLDVVNLKESDSTRLDFYLKNFGAKKLVDKLLTDSKGGDSIDCHRQAHFIGREAFKLFGAEVFSLNDYSCHSGFIHGAMEAFLTKRGTANLKEDVDGLCSHLPTGFGRFECLHGVGHGVMAYQDYNLPEAIKECQKLGDDYSSSSCYGGLFMENVIAGQGNAAIIGHTTNWVSQDPYFPCDAVDQDAGVQVQCYMMQTSRMLDIYHYNFDQVAAACLQARTDYQNICFQSFGRDAAGQALRDPAKIISYCSKVKGIYYNYCITGAVNVIIDFWGIQLADKPYLLCKMVVDPQAKNSCYQVVGQRLIGVLGERDKIINSCSFAEMDYQSVCRQAGQV